MRMSPRLLLACLLAAAALPAAAGHDHDHAAAAATPPGSAADCWLPAFKAADVDAVAACYVADAVMYFPSGPTAEGRDAIRAGYAEFFATYTIKDAVIDEVGHVAAGDTRTAWGRYTITLVPKAGGAEIVGTGRFTDVARFVDGHWRYVVDHASDDPPPAAEK